MKKNSWLATPYLIWMGIFIILPLLLIVYYGFTIKDLNGELIFSLANFTRAFDFMYLKIIGKSIILAFQSVLICFLIGYPVAFILSRSDFSKGSTILFLIIAPMWMNFLLRTYSWLSILEKNGLLSNFLSLFGFAKRTFLYTDGAVLLGMTYNYLPFMILPVYTVLSKMDKSIIEAAQDLGANSLQVFLKVIFPLSIPGVISGITMVFMPAVTTFIISNILGGAQYMLIGNLIEQQFRTANDWNFGSALSLILMVIILITMGIFEMADKDPENSSKKGGQLM